MELGVLLAKAQHALNAILQPEHLYIGRYGHTAKLALHFHLIPICAWVKRGFFSDPRYRVLQGLSGDLLPGNRWGRAHALCLAGVLRKPDATRNRRSLYRRGC